MTATWLLVASLVGASAGSIGCRSGCGPSATSSPAANGAAARPPCNCFFVGGDARDDRAHVVRWALRTAKEQNAGAFIFLGDMELNPQWDPTFQKELAELDPIPFFPVIGNHEVKLFGFIGTDRQERLTRFQKRFLGTPRTPVTSKLSDRVAYSADLDGGVHFVALDNVTGSGFGQAQLDWLQSDLVAARARSSIRYVVVGMHKALAHNGVTTHSMDEDGDVGAHDSGAALALFRQSHVDFIFASHQHEGMAFTQEGIRSYITGGLGAPIAREAPSGAEKRHHMLRVDVRDAALDVTVVPFEGPTLVADKDEDEGKE
jgi:hypothetical protein